MCIFTYTRYYCGLLQSLKSEPCARHNAGQNCTKKHLYKLLEERCPWTCANIPLPAPPVIPLPAPPIENRKDLGAVANVEGADGLGGTDQDGDGNDAGSTDRAGKGSLEDIEESTNTVLDPFFLQQEN